MSVRRQLRSEVDREPNWRSTVALDPEHFATSAVYLPELAVQVRAVMRV